MIFNVLLLVLTLKFLFCGISKVFWYKETITFASNLEFFPNKVGRVLGSILPMFEILIFFSLLFFNNLLIYIFISFYCLFFIALNLKAVAEKRNIPCFCYGKLLKSNLGWGGFFNFFSYLIITIICLFISTESMIVLIRNLSSYELLPIFLVTGIIFAGLIIGQSYGDKLSGRV